LLPKPKGDNPGRDHTIKYVLDNIINVTPDKNSLFQPCQIVSF
jgi:hypothetical protein